MPKYVAGNRLTLLHNGAEYFPELARAIGTARREIFLETYIFADDGAGSLIAEALARAAARGVQVHLLLDGFGAKNFSPRFRALLEQAGAGILVFRPDLSPWRLRRNRLRRMHRKLACVDGSIAFVGGINVIDDFDTPGHLPPRFDYAVRIEGPLAAVVGAEAAKLWSRVAWASLGRRRAGMEWTGGQRLDPHATPAACAENQHAALVVRDNVRHRRDIEQAYYEMIESAREEILIACAYFFPGRRFRQALARAARRGVRVRLLLQGRVEYLLLHYASRALYGSLLDAGIQIHEYHRSFMHAKVAVFDGSGASIGSSNIDPFSLLLAREANVFARDARFAAELRASLEEAIAHSVAMAPRQWKAQSIFLRARSWVAYGLARMLVAFFGPDRAY